MSHLEFSFTGKSESQTKLVGKARNFNITIDEPPELGGKDEAANPVEYTLASLAGCLNVVAHLIAKELNINIFSLQIKVKGIINPDKLLTGTPTDRAGFKEITVTLDLESDANEATQKVWLALVKERCPVTDNLVNPTDLKITI